MKIKIIALTWCLSRFDCHNFVNFNDFSERKQKIKRNFSHHFVKFEFFSTVTIFTIAKSNESVAISGFYSLRSPIYQSFNRYIYNIPANENKPNDKFHCQLRKRQKHIEYMRRDLIHFFLFSSSFSLFSIVYL